MVRDHEYEITVEDIPEHPLMFTTPADEFVDREDILDELYHMALLVRIRRKANQAFIGRRRIGKSAIIERLYNYLWNTQHEIIPLYFSFVGKSGSNYIATLREMFGDFLIQYLSFTDLVDPESAKDEPLD